MITQLHRIALALLVCCMATPAASQTPATPPTAQIWESATYGLLVDRSGARSRIYMRGGGVCALAADLGPTASDGLTVETGADGSGSVIVQGVSRYPVQPITAIPPECLRFQAQRDPLVTFDAMVAIFRESYPFFAARGVDWQPQVAGWRQRATGASAAALWTLLTEMMAPLRDAHVTLTDGDRRWSRSRNERATAPDADGVTPNGRALQSALLAWLNGAQSPLAAPPVVDAGGYVVSGLTRAGTCYVAVLEMADFAGDDAGDAADSAALAAALDRTAARCATASATIVDLRYNPGGDDRHGVALAARIARAPYTAYTKRAFGPGGWTAPYPITVTPSARPPLPPRVAVLIGPRTISAAETTALALKSGGAVVIGSNAQGALSDMLARRLPNGWMLTLSNEDYAAPDGRSLEATGLAPDIASAEPTTSVAARFGTAIAAAETALTAR